MPPRKKTPTAPPVEKPVFKVDDDVTVYSGRTIYSIVKIDGCLAYLRSGSSQRTINVAHLHYANTHPEPEPVQPPTPVPTPPAKKEPTRTCGWRWRHVTQAFGVFHITNGITTEYLYERCSSTLHTITKMERGRKTTYNVYISKTVQECGCQAYKPSAGCKHIECLVTLLGLELTPKS